MSPVYTATGQPTISGTARVGETLTADTSGIADADGLFNTTFRYQWMRSDGLTETDIADASGPSYELAAADEGKTIKVRVSFENDAGNDETLTSAATSLVVFPPLTVRLVNAATSHDGSAAFTFEIWFSEEFPLSYKTLKFHAFDVTGGTISKSQRMERPSNIPWRITVQPNSNEDVTVVLPVTEDCGVQGAICTKDGRKLSNRLEFTVSGPSG